VRPAQCVAKQRLSHTRVALPHSEHVIPAVAFLVEVRTVKADLKVIVPEVAVHRHKHDTARGVSGIDEVCVIAISSQRLLEAIQAHVARILPLRGGQFPIGMKRLFYFVLLS
jgi:hypothetical protein